MQDLDALYRNIVAYSERQFRGLDKLNRKDYALALREARAVVSDAYRKYGSKGTLTYSEMQKYNRIAKLDAMLEDAIRNNTNTVAKRTRTILSETASGSYDLSSAAMSAVTGSVLTKELTAKEIITILQKPISGWSLNERMALRRSDLVIRVQGEVKRRLLRSASVEDTWKGVKTVIEKVYARDRTMLADDVHRISQEAIRAEVEREKAALKKEGLFPSLVWVAVMDERTRESHVDMDGQEVLAGEPFVFKSGPNKGATTFTPGQSGIPGEDINCRCYVVANVKKINDV